MRFSRIHLILLSAFIVVGAFSAYSQEEPILERKRAYKGWYKIKDEYGDSIRLIELNDVPIYPPLVFKNKQEEEFYWRTVRDVRKALPYAKAAGNALLETYEYIQTIPDQKEREKHLQHMEKDIVAEYKPAIMKFTKNQGKVLLKLINRETNQSSYNIVKAFLGSFRAGFWQTFGRFFGMNMKAGYDPLHNKEDFLIERIADQIELGIL